jgi:hypothetical protein
MATYTELHTLIGSSGTLRSRLAVAIAIKAYGYVTAVSPTAEQVAWGKQAIQNPTNYVDAVLHGVLAANKDATTAAITAATDAQVQTAVDAVVQNLLAK